MYIDFYDLDSIVRVVGVLVLEFVACCKRLGERLVDIMIFPDFGGGSGEALEALFLHLLLQVGSFDAFIFVCKCGQVVLCRDQ